MGQFFEASVDGELDDELPDEPLEGVELVDDELLGALLVVELTAAVAALATRAAPVTNPPVSAAVMRTLRMRSFMGNTLLS